MRALARSPRAASSLPGLPSGPWPWPSLLPKRIQPLEGSPCVCLSVQPLPFIYFSGLPSRGEGASPGAGSEGHATELRWALQPPSTQWPSRTRWTDPATPAVFLCLWESFHLVLHTSACLAAGAALHALNTPQGALRHPYAVPGRVKPSLSSIMSICPALSICPVGAGGISAPASSSSVLCPKQWPWPAGP